MNEHERTFAERAARVLLAADAYTRTDLLNGDEYDELCAACEAITDTELAELISTYYGLPGVSAGDG